MGADCSVLEQAAPQLIGKADTFAKPSGSGTAFEDKYQIGQSLASKVFVVRHRVTQAIYVAYRLKRKRGEELDESTMSQLKALDHPNICHLVEVFSDERYFFLVYSKVCGLPLLAQAAKLAKENNFSESKVASMARQAVRALAIAAEAGIAHGALLPKNMFWGSNGQLEITDFGLAGLLKASPLEKGACGATMPYLAPEIVRLWAKKAAPMFQHQRRRVSLAREEFKATPAADIWSFGVIIFMLFSGGQLPFVGDVSNGELADRICCGKFRYTLEMESQLSDEARDFISECLQMDPDKRPTAVDLLKHPWFTQQLPTAKKTMKLDVCQQLSTIHAESHFKRAMMRLIATKVSPSKIKDLEAAFESMDTDCDGMLSLDEVRAGLTRHPDLAKCFENDELATVFSEIDVDKSGKISFREFIAVTIDSQRDILEQILWDTFKAIDTDRSGHVTPKELLAAVHAIEGRLGQGHMEQIEERLKEELATPMNFDEFRTLVCEEGGRGRLAEESPSVWHACSPVRNCSPRIVVTRSPSFASTDCPSSPGSRPSSAAPSPSGSPRPSSRFTAGGRESIEGQRPQSARPAGTALIEDDTMGRRASSPPNIGIGAGPNDGIDSNEPISAGVFLTAPPRLQVPDAGSSFKKRRPPRLPATAE